MAERKNTRTTNSTKNKSNTGCLIWLLIMLLIFIAFFANKDAILKVLENTKFTDASGIPLKPLTEMPKDDSQNQIVVPLPNENKPVNAVDPEPSIKNIDIKPIEVKPVEAKPVDAKPDTEKPNSEKPIPAKPEPSKPVPKVVKPATDPITTPNATYRISVLYFVSVDADGNISRVSSKRNIKIQDSPLKDSINSLLKGPTQEELQKGLITLIPSGSKLLSVTLQGSTAVVNLSEAFMYNTLGIEGYYGQLKQLIFTATEYPTVKDVQILIEGKKVNYLGGEGVFVGKPLSRNSF